MHSIGDEMVKFPYVTAKSCSIKDALLMMKELRIRHLPIADDNKKIVGVVSDRDLREAAALPQAEILTVSDVMKTGVYRVTADVPLKEAVLGMANKRYGCTIVVNRRGEAIGIFTTTDALYLLADLMVGEGMEDILGFGDEYVPWATVAI